MPPLLLESLLAACALQPLNPSTSEPRRIANQNPDIFRVLALTNPGFIAFINNLRLNIYLTFARQ
jgi:hypothetical protein